MRGESVDQDELYFKRDRIRPAYLSVTARPLAGGSEKVRGAVCVFRDVTEKKHLQSEQERLLRETQEAVRIRDEFMSIASHELKTPLAPLRTQVQILQRLSKTNQLKQFPPDKLEKLMNFTDSQVKRLVSLIENLLDVTRITSGKLHLNLENVRLAPLVRDILEQHRPEIQQAGSPIKTEVDENIVAYWDRYRIEQVLANLLTNALKYGKGKEIRIATRPLPDGVIISVQDQGIGISEDDQKRIFGRFERAVSMAHYGGLGLGLYISKQIVMAHGGTIRIESQVDHGSNFIVELPWKVGAEGTPQAAA
jgi:signal transduction histidine kinase